MDTSFLLVGIGGFFGSVLRYWVAIFVGRQLATPFPFGTFVVNAVGCFIIGVVAGVSERSSLLSPEVRFLLRPDSAEVLLPSQPFRMKV